MTVSETTRRICCDVSGAVRRRVTAWEKRRREEEEDEEGGGKWEETFAYRAYDRRQAGRAQ